MGGLAALAQEAGFRVTGSDRNVYPPMSTQLAAQGIELIEGYDAEQLELAPDIVVVGNAVSRGNPSMEAILDRGLPYVSGPAVAGRARAAGTNGCSRRGHARQDHHLEHAGLAARACRTLPGFLIGGVPRNFGVSARLAATCSS